MLLSGYSCGSLPLQQRGRTAQARGTAQQACSADTRLPFTIQGAQSTSVQPPHRVESRTIAPPDWKLHAPSWGQRKRTDAPVCDCTRQCSKRNLVHPG